MIDFVLRAGEEIIDAKHVVAVSEQVIAKVRADEPFVGPAFACRADLDYAFQSDPLEGALV